MENIYSGLRLVVDLTAIKANYQILKKKLHNRSECGAALKANAYGLGAKKIAKILEAEGCKNFFVANIDEALEVKPIISNSNIYILHGVLNQEEMEICIKFNFIPVLNYYQQIESWNNFAIKKNQKLPAVIHFDTAMSRLGLTIEDAELLFDNKNQILSNINLLYNISHLASADDNRDILNKTQLQEIQKIAHYFSNIPISLSNSSGIFLGEEYHFDLCRPGGALYGLNPTPRMINPMNNCIKLLAKILQIRHLKSNSTVGYNATYSALAGSKLATLSCGYADGYMRKYSNNSYCMINNYKADIVGRISMDLITIDVSNVPERELFIGAEVELIGPSVTPDVLAKYSGTVGYEVIASLGNRIKREYVYK